MKFITLEGITFSYTKNTPLFQNLSLTFSLGEQVAIIGRNGSGKTTLVKLILGMLRPEQGSIYINNEPTLRKTIAEIATQIGFVFQNPNLMLFTNSVEKELILSLQRFKLSKEELKKRIEETMNFFELGKYRNTNPRNLSRGEKQKVALATVFIQKPKAIILDEPFSGIDMTQKLVILQYLQRLKEEGKLIILITHALDLLPEACTRVIALDKGRLIYDLSFEAFFADLSRLQSIGLELPDYFLFVQTLREKGLPPEVIKKQDIKTFLLKRALQ